MFALLRNVWFGVLACLSASLFAAEPVLLTFQRQTLTDVYFSEGIAAGDLNRDGVPDIVYGPYWFEGPGYTTRREIYEAKPQNTRGYADHFFCWVYDFDNNGWNDVLVVGFPGTPAFVYENPGDTDNAAGSSRWKKHQVLDWVSNESPQFVQLVGDQRPELVCSRDGFFGFATIADENAFGPWKFRPISDQITDRKFGHGLGIGDVNGDGRADVLHAQGWFEQPADNALEARWAAREADFSQSYGGAEMHVYDVDGDGDHDIITSQAAHHFGLGWYEQVQNNGQETFAYHEIMGATPQSNPYGVLFSEPHSVALADIDGDGLKDIVTGKTYWSHHEKSPMWDTGAVVYWFKLVRDGKSVEWVPHLASPDPGIGRQLTVTDLNQDGQPDLLLGGMKGANVLLQQRKVVSASEWQAAQPQKIDFSAQPTKPLATAIRGTKAKFEAKQRALANVIEGEALASRTKATAGTARPQPMGGFKADRWSQDSHLWWTGAKAGDRLEIELPEFSGTVDLELALTCAPDYGIVQLTLDDQKLGDPIDLYDPQVVSTGILKFPRREMLGRKHRLGIQIMGLNPAATPSYMVGLDYVRISTGDGKFVMLPKVQSGTPETTAVQPALQADEYPHAGLAAAKAAAAMKLPTGFRVVVGASEPQVTQPIAMALDHRGRIWIAEAYEYPRRANGDSGCDRILIFEDTDQNGSLDKRTVFAEGLNLVSGLEVGFGGVWVGAAPYLMFIPDQNGDDVPDGKPQILLDGWGYQDTHETLNTFIWGPDGWLYGCHGVFTHSRVGKPGTPDNERVPINAGVWRYHPLKHQFEVFAHGTSNPWGVDFNDHGQAFVTACVIPHLFHIIQGGRYNRQAGQHFNPYTYRDIPTIADHRHYLGANPHGGNHRSDEAGGGHAHAGAMIYLGGHWPQQYRNQIFMNNIHGQRLNVDLLEPRGSGYVGKHGPDFLLTGDQASQILNLRYTYDGNAWMIDWYDMQACHRVEIDRHDRSNGRIYKIVYGDQQPIMRAPDLLSKSDRELAEFVLHPNDWYVRHGRRLLQERSSVQSIAPEALERLREIASSHAEDTRRLRALWALHVVGGLSPDFLANRAADPSPYVRAWLIQLTREREGNAITDETLAQWVNRAETDDSPIVRLYLASAAQQLAPARRWSLIEALTSHAQDASDHNLVHLYWYAAEPLAEVDAEHAIALALSVGDRLPIFRDQMLRRVGSGEGPMPLNRLVSAIVRSNKTSDAKAALTALRTVIAGRSQVPQPEGWPDVLAKWLRSDDAEIRSQVLSLGGVFGDEASLRSLRMIVLDEGMSLGARREAFQAVLDARDKQAPELLRSLVSTAGPLRQNAIQGLAQFDHPESARALLDQYASLSAEEKSSALAALTARRSYANSLLDAVQSKRVPATDLTADIVRQLQFLKDPAIDEILTRVWGRMRASNADKLTMIEKYKQLVASNRHDQPDLALGREVFTKTCMKCHMLYGEGYKIGPDLTGSNRSDLDYLLSNIVDPSSVMAKEYMPTIVLMQDGRVISGLVKEDHPATVTIQTTDAVVRIAKDEIESQSISEQSMMPEDQLRQFNEHEVRSLIAYLRAKAQVPFKAGTQ